MKKSHRRPIAVLLAAAVSLSAFGGLSPASAADSEGKKEVKLIYKIDEDATAGKTTDLSLFEPSTTSDGHTNIPAGNFTKKGYIFSGWTYDDVVGYSSGQFVSLPEDKDEVEFHICWIDPSAEKHTVKYVLERDGITFETPEWLEEESYYPNEVFNPNDTTVFVEKETEEGTLKYISKWLTDGERVYSFGTQLVMPDHDITLYPILYKKIQLKYFAGDVDRLNGNSEFSFEKMEGSSDELAGRDRFSRSGFDLVGWKSSIDGTVYKPTETIVMPGDDVVFTAVWQPIEYKIVFNPGNGGSSIKIPAKTDDTITLPDPGITVEGKHFAGWKINGGTEVLPAGEEYKVLGAISGMGISFKGVWEDGDAPATTTAPVSTTSTATTTSTTATTTVTTTAATTTEPIATGTSIAEDCFWGTWALSKILNEDGSEADSSDFTKDIFVFDSNHTFTGTNSCIYKGETYNSTLKWKVRGDFIYITAEEDVIGMPNKSEFNMHYDTKANHVLTLTSENGKKYIYEEVIFGDANNDKKVSVADSVAILQSIANRDKFALSLYGKAAADVDGEAGVTANDALVIQKYDAKAVTELPVK